jgi:mycothiol synthase
MTAGVAPTALTWRPITGEDVEAWAELLRAAEAVDHTGENYDADDLTEELADASIDYRHDSIAVFDGDRMVGYGIVRGKPALGGTVFQVQTEGQVHPGYRRRGIGRMILDGAFERASEMHAERGNGLPCQVVVYANDRITGVRALAEAAGMTAMRWWFEMDRDLSEPVEVRPVPDGYRITGFDPASDEQLRVAHNEAFAGHWGSVERDPEFWRQWVSGSRAFRPEVSRLLWEGAEIAAYLLVYEYDADTVATGVREAWIGQVGTRPPWRGRGLASTLMTHVLAACREAGYQRASLSVDTGNATGALGIYERAGFVTCERATSYARSI